MSDETTEGTAGIGMFVAAYVDERGADNAYKQLKEAKKSGDFYYDDAAILRRSAKGKVHIDEKGDMTTGKGAAIGGLVGATVALLLGPGGILAGAVIGGIAAHGDAGFDNDSLKEIGGALPSGTSAIVATTSKKFVEEVHKQADPGQTLTVARDIAKEINGHLTAREDVLMGMVLTEDGVAAGKVVSSPTAVAAFGIVATEEGVVAGQAVATDAGAAYEVAAETEEGVAYEAGVATEEGAVVVDAVATPVEEEGEEEEEESSDS